MTMKRIQKFLMFNNNGDEGGGGAKGKQVMRKAIGKSEGRLRAPQRDLQTKTSHHRNSASGTSTGGGIGFGIGNNSNSNSNGGTVIVRDRRQEEDEEMKQYAFSMNLTILVAIAFYAAALARGFAAFDSRDRKWQVSKKYEPNRGVEWNYGIEYDGWTLAHEGLRGEIKEFHSTLLSIVKGKRNSFSDAQVKALQKWWKGHHEHMQNHITNEAKITNSLIKERFQLPEFMRKDQSLIIEHLQQIDLNVDVVKHESPADRIPAIRELLLSWHIYGKDVERHFKAWEQQGISLMRAYFSPDEIQAITNRLSKLGSRIETGAIVHYVGQSRLRVAMSKQQNPISSLSWNLIIQPRIDYYKKNMLLHLDIMLGVDRSEEL